MMLRRPSGLIAPCQPSKAAEPPSGPLWVHEVKHDGYRLMVHPSQRAVEGVDQDEDPGERGGAPGARGGVALDAPTAGGPVTVAVRM